VFPATLFDYNGVLVDDEVVHLEAFRDVLRPRGISLDEKAYWDRYLGFDDVGAFRAIFVDNGRELPDDEVRRLVEEKRPLYLKRAREVLKGFDGAPALVRRRAKFGPVGIVSGALRDEIRLGLDVLGVRDVVSTIVSAEDTSSSKPDPEGYLRGVAELSSQVGGEVARLAVAIEDSVAGVEAAKSAGLVCIAVSHSYPASRLEQAGADLVVASLDEITEPLLGSLYRRLHQPEAAAAKRS
jgi:beta-phosphoglucomutase-like phosphatase (HAD superfamily)